MTRFLLRFRRKRRVRLHISTAYGPVQDTDSADTTLEGVELGIVAGFHVLQLARLLSSEDTATSLEGLVEVPRERVIFRQVLR